MASFRTFLRCVCVHACVRACVCVWRGTSDPMRALSSMVGTPCGVLWVRERLQSEPASSALTEAISKFSRSSLAFHATRNTRQQVTCDVARVQTRQLSSGSAQDATLSPCAADRASPAVSSTAPSPQLWTQQGNSRAAEESLPDNARG